MCGSRSDAGQVSAEGGHTQKVRAKEKGLIFDLYPRRTQLERSGRVRVQNLQAQRTESARPL